MTTLQRGAAGTPVGRGTGTLTLTVLEDYAFAPANTVTAPTGWTVVNDHGRTMTVIARTGSQQGTFDVGFTFGAGSAPVTVIPQWWPATRACSA